MYWRERELEYYPDGQPSASASHACAENIALNSCAQLPRHDFLYRPMTLRQTRSFPTTRQSPYSGLAFPYLCSRLPLTGTPSPSPFKSLPLPEALSDPPNESHNCSHRVALQMSRERKDGLLHLQHCQHRAGQGSPVGDGLAYCRMLAASYSLVYMLTKASLSNDIKKQALGKAGDHDTGGQMSHLRGQV